MRFFKKSQGDGASQTFFWGNRHGSLISFTVKQSLLNYTKQATSAQKKIITFDLPTDAKGRLLILFFVNST